MTNIGYAAGVFDLFHIGHVNLLRNARSLCNRLIVGVSTDELVESSKKMRKPVIPFSERIEVVKACRFVDVAIPQTDHDKFAAYERLKFTTLFVGDDWFLDPSWRDWESQLKNVGVSVIYFPYTQGQSSSKINQILIRERYQD